MARAAKSPEEVAKIERSLPWWGKILIGGTIIGVIANFTPIVEILKASFVLVVVPSAFLLGFGLISSGTFQAINDGWHNTMSEVNRRVAEKVRAATDDRAAA